MSMIPPGAFNLDPATLASLQNTLGPTGLLSQQLVAAQAEAQKQQEAIKAAAGAASQQSAQAGQAYQAAAAAPTPSLSPLDQSLPQLLGNVASVVSGDKGYSNRAAEGVTSASNDLMTARIQNLQALKDHFDKTAATAAHMNDVADEGAARLQSEKISGTLAQLLKTQEESAAKDAAKAAADAAMARVQQHDKNTLANTALMGQNAIATEKVKLGGTIGGGGVADQEAQKYVKTFKSQDANGKPTSLDYIDQSKIPPKLKQLVTDYGYANGKTVLNAKEVQAVHLVNIARNALRQALADQKQFAGKDWVDQLRKDPGIFWKNARRDPNVRAYAAHRTAAISAIQAISNLGTGMRINQGLIHMAQAQDIGEIWDPYPTGQKKVGTMLSQLDNVVNELFTDSQGDASAPANAGSFWDQHKAVH